MVFVCDDGMGTESFDCNEWRKDGPAVHFDAVRMENEKDAMMGSSKSKWRRRRSKSSNTTKKQEEEKDEDQKEKKLERALFTTKSFLSFP